MKNIHIIPTDKPSRLILQGSELVLSKYLEINEGFSEFNQNIYITSDEEIKKGDWVLLDNSIKELPDYQGLHLIQILDRVLLKSATALQCKKIILTTDQDLIKDGVQAIDDEFLEWFVKNPSCEFVEVDLWTIEKRKGEYFNPPLKEYEIIIPQEEPKQEYYCKACGISQDEPFSKCHESHKHCSCEIRLTEEPKQETLEKAAENYVRNESDASLKLISKYSFKDGAKWQAEKDKQIINSLNNTLNKIGQKHIDNLFKDKPERMYSEEDMIQFSAIAHLAMINPTNNKSFEELFEQFKKK